jgi:hypothetical protein
VVHCLLTPVLLSMSAVFAHFLPSEERTHRTLAVVVSLAGCMALVRGYRNHRRVLIPSLMAGGLACIFFGAFGGNLLASHWLEVGITFVGSGLMIAAHRLNHTFCQRCECSKH